jgi:hypothetical protein
MRMVRSKVAGVSHANHDGSSRQRIIRKYCRAGRSLEVRLEPDNRYSEDAMGLWVRGRCLLIIPAWYQVGYIKNELASQIREDVVRGCPISVRILDVTGGGWPRRQYRGVNIEIRLGREYEPSAEKKAHPPAPVKSAPNPAGAMSRSAAACWFFVTSKLAGLLSHCVNVGFRLARSLATRYAALPRNEKVIAIGACVAFAGLALWAIGYVSEKTLGSIFVLRAIGVVAVIVGSGVSCLGIVYFLTDSRNDRS